MHSCTHRQNCTVTQRALCVNTLFLWFSSFTADINPGFAVDRHVLGCVRSLVSLSLLSFTVHTLPWTPQDLYSFCLLINPHQRLWMPLHQTYNTLLSASRLLFYFIHKQVKPVPPPLPGTQLPPKIVCASFWSWLIVPKEIAAISLAFSTICHTNASVGVVMGKAGMI